MKVNNTYPSKKNKKFQRKQFINAIRWPYLIIAITCPIVNFCVGGPIWSPIAMMGMYVLWHLVIAIDLIEYNRISQVIKTTIYSCIILGMIDALLAPGWAPDVIALVCFGSLIVSGILFFTDYKKQRQNLQPMYYLIVISIVGCIVGLFDVYEAKNWILISLGGVAVALLIAIIFVLRSDFIKEFKCRFHVK